MKRRTLDELATVDLGTLSATENARYAIEAEESLREAERAENRSQSSENSRRLWAAMMLAPVLAVFEELVSGRPVAGSKLASAWFRRFPRFRR